MSNSVGSKTRGIGQSTIASTFSRGLFTVFNAYNKTLIAIMIYERTLSIGLFLHLNNYGHGGKDGVRCAESFYTLKSRINLDSAFWKTQSLS